MPAATVGDFFQHDRCPNTIVPRSAADDRSCCTTHENCRLMLAIPNLKLDRPDPSANASAIDQAAGYQLFKKSVTATLSMNP
jgi:hypothetical protein